MDKTGKEGLTRNGNLKIDQNGLLTNGSGHLVLGETVRQSPYLFH